MLLVATTPLRSPPAARRVGGPGPGPGTGVSRTHDPSLRVIDHQLFLADRSLKLLSVLDFRLANADILCDDDVLVHSGALAGERERHGLARRQFPVIDQ